MSLQAHARAMVLPLLPCRVLAFGYPEGLSESDLKGSELTVVDVIAHKGCELLADLNEPQEFGEFDLVIDPGTFEHCANPGQAIRTAMQSVRLGGHILHTMPVTMVGHGFWNYCPELVPALHKVNGFETLKWEFRTLSEKPISGTFRRTTSFPLEAGASALGRRVRKQPWAWPRQGIYA